MTDGLFSAYNRLSRYDEGHDAVRKAIAALQPVSDPASQQVLGSLLLWQAYYEVYYGDIDYVMGLLGQVKQIYSDIEDVIDPDRYRRAEQGLLRAGERR